MEIPALSVKFRSLMAPSVGFVAYGSSFEIIGQTIEFALQIYAARQATGRFASWQENDTAGRFLAAPILENIADTQCLVADISGPNFNVTYEIGYSIGLGKRAVLIKNKSLNSDEGDLRRVGIFDTLGYLLYENSQDLYKILTEMRDFSPLVISSPLNSGAPVYMLQLPFNTDAQGRIIARIKKARLRYRSFDPAEQVRLAAPEAIDNVASSYGVIVPLAPKSMVDAGVHNLRAAFIAGLARGMGKALCLIQAGEDPVPLDYRDLVETYVDPRQIDGIIERFALDVTDALQAKAQTKQMNGGLLASLDMGSSTAENEFVTLGEYYVQTDEFRRASRGEARIVVGRKGSGKTAVFAQVRDRIRSDRQQIVLDLKPEGYQLLKFKEQIIDFLEEGTQEHTITAFWEYLLLLEAAYKILEKDRSVHIRDHELYEPYQALARAYNEDTYSQEGDFSERMLRLVEKIAENFKQHYPSGTNTRLTRQQVTEFVHLHDIHELRTQVENYLKLKKGLWILFDNLDKGWKAHGLAKEDLLIIRTLLDATRKIEQSLQPKGIDCHTIVFLRNDVYSLLVDTTPDRGKEIRVSLDWTEADLLRELVRRRLVYGGLTQEEPFDQLWRNIFVSLIDGEESSQYLIDKSMMRPRFLLNLISHCRGYAVNLGHEKIEADDIHKGLNAFSTDLVFDIDLEIRDVLPVAEDVLFTFFGQNARLDERDVQLLLENRFGPEEALKIRQLLLWYGVLGVVRTTDEIAFIYSVNYDIRRLIAVLDGLPPDQRRFYINPAFWPGLEIKDDSRLL